MMVMVVDVGKRSQILDLFESRDQLFDLNELEYGEYEG